MAELKTKLVGNFLRNATAQQILNAEAEEVWNVGEVNTKDCCQLGTVVGNMLHNADNFRFTNAWR